MSISYKFRGEVLLRTKISTLTLLRERSGLLVRYHETKTVKNSFVKFLIIMKGSTQTNLNRVQMIKETNGYEERNV